MLYAAIYMQQPDRENARENAQEIAEPAWNCEAGSKVRRLELLRVDVDPG